MLNTITDSLQSTGYALIDPAMDYIVIRGTRIDLDTIVNPVYLTEEKIAELRDKFLNAKPFPHFVIDGLFNPKLLELVSEEFTLRDKKSWRLIEGNNERTHRLPPPSISFGQATQLYFNIINSGWFINFLSAISGIKHLIPDPLCHNGGMHEVREGGFFDIHLDFNLHHQTLLHNEIILITYLNKNWRAEYGGSLELWDSATQSCAAEILPEFGRTVLFRHDLTSFHGHPKPIHSPDHTPRRSVANYYYSNRQGEKYRYQQHWTLFYPNAKVNRWYKTLYHLKYDFKAASEARKLLKQWHIIKNKLFS